MSPWGVSFAVAREYRLDYQPRMRRKVLCIGLDAADKDLILQWAGEGRLPTLHSLLQRGAWGTSVNPTGLFVGAVWPSFTTAVSPGRHGYYCPEQLRPGTYEVRRVRSADFDLRPFWGPISRAGRRVAIIDVPFTTPMRDLNGVQLCNWRNHDIDLDEHFGTWPVGLASEIGARFGKHSITSCDTRVVIDGVRALRDDLLHRVRIRTDLLEHLLDRGGWDLVLATYSESHCAGHHFWHLHDANHLRYGERAAFAVDPLLELYEALDAAVSRLLQRVDEQTVIIVLATHGFGPHYDATFLLDEILRRFEQLPPPDPPRGEAIRRAMLSAWQSTPRPLRRLLRPVRDQVVRRLYLGPRLLDGRRKCLQIPNNDACGGIRLNVVGREPTGRVQPGAQYEQLCQDLERCLMELTNTATGAPVVRRVLRTTDLYQGPRLDYLPDLIVEWMCDTPVSSVSSPRLGRIDGLPHTSRTGDHLRDGLWMASGPSVRAGYYADPVSVMDFGPTIAAILGVDLEGVDGKPIAAILS